MPAAKVPPPTPTCPDFRQLTETKRSHPVPVGAMSSSTLTSDGAAWLASAGTYPRSTLAFWEERPDAPVVLPCGSAFDIVSAPAIFGRQMLDRLWDEGPGSGPVAVFRGRMLLFATPGTAQRLPSLLEWEEWGATGPESHGRTAAIPPLLCHGTGDAVTVPAPTGKAEVSGSRWVVAPDTRHPWLPGPEILLWAAVRAARSAVRISIFPPPDQGAKVYDVSRRR
ncbi:bifunctional DNA primase/polymerase [Streptomyces gossypiisoli]|uniref:bifunctional DNA primase/polymerase n=1 Tax=Streptomyces TaxID=1883 RepID=UPI0015D997AF